MDLANAIGAYYQDTVSQLMQFVREAIDEIAPA